MLERTYQYKGYTIEQYVYGTGSKKRRYFYPACNGNYECTDIRDVIKWIRGLIWINRISKEMGVLL
ncbi:hypothetical protein Q4E40_02860 [Pontibacter sp. BT731]|uniref:hypothetical protein n=1 Tax=Pontibacter coccineus TaxID=3063328 RepID=UPI0026E3A94E|nr:hypothetical protein [Pontibacter sp. BT731]MDO6389054.1 hypothetical protein [Pontibacter sp. BT731]